MMSYYIPFLAQLAFFIAFIIGYIGVAIMAFGAFRSVYHFIKTRFDRDKIILIRIEMGQHIALGLEFFIVKDIIETIIQPSWDDLGKLAVIILLRSMLSLFLSKELKELEQKELLQRNAKKTTK